MTITAFDQALLSGAVTGAMRKFVEDGGGPPSAVQFVDIDGNHQPITDIDLPSNRFLVPVIHVSANGRLLDDHQLASQLADLAREAGNERLARLLGLVAGLFDDAEIARVIGDQP